MRKIEQAMVDALRTRKPFNSGNTKVTQTMNQALIYLHGNHIATLTYDLTSAPAHIIVTNAGWNTRTTSSRLHAIVSAFFPGEAFVNIQRGCTVAHVNGPQAVVLSGGRGARIYRHAGVMHCVPEAL